MSFVPFLYSFLHPAVQDSDVTGTILVHEDEDQPKRRKSSKTEGATEQNSYRQLLL